MDPNSSDRSSQENTDPTHRYVRKKRLAKGTFKEVYKAFDEEEARNDAIRQLEPSWGRWLRVSLVDPLFAGCLPSKPLALIGARQMAQKTTPCGRVCPLIPSRASTILLYS